MMALPINTGELLHPISRLKPAGDDLQDNIVFTTIRRARESEPDYLPRGEWQTIERRVADWEKVQRLTSTALREESKDLQLACWFVESQGHLRGLSGVITGLEFLIAFISRFWFSCWPQQENDDITVRRNPLIRLDRDISQLILYLPLCKVPISALSFWRQVLAFEHKIGASPDARQDFIAQEGDFTLATFGQQSKHFDPETLAVQKANIQGIIESLNVLESSYQSLSQDSDSELFTLTRQMVAEMSEYVQYLSPDQQPVSLVADTDTDTDTDTVLPAPDTILSRDSLRIAVKTTSRESAIQQLADIAAWFRQAEPSSPVPFLLERAIRWADMPLTTWLEEMLGDGNTLQDINAVLTGQRH